MATLGDIIKEYRFEHQMSMDDFAKASGISKAYISTLEKNINPHNGKQIVPTVEYIAKAAKGMFMSFDDLFAMIDKNSSIRLTENVISRRAIRIPVLGHIAAGIPISAIEDILDYEEISDNMAHTGDFFGLRIKGDSMEPRIADGSVVIVRQQSDAENGSIVVAMVNGYEAVCKKLVKGKNGITLMSLNTAYNPMMYSNEEIESLPVRIMGKVVEVRTKLE